MGTGNYGLGSKGLRGRGSLFLPRPPLSLHAFLAAAFFLGHRLDVLPVDLRPAVRAKNASRRNGLAALAPHFNLLPYYHTTTIIRHIRREDKETGTANTYRPGGRYSISLDTMPVKPAKR